MAPDFAWVAFYEGFADALARFRGKSGELFKIIKKAAASEPLMHYLHMEDDEFWAKRNFRIDPFSVTAIFNRATTDRHRHDLGLFLANLVGAPLSPPEVFHGIAHLDPRRSIYNGVEEIWNLFAAALDSGTGGGFVAAYDAAAALPGNALATLSIALFWARPRVFMAVDAMSRPYMEREYGIAVPHDKCDGAMYASFLEELRPRLPQAGFPAVAYASWAAGRK